MLLFARVSGDFMFYSEMRECGKSEQNLASCYYLLVVKLVVKRGWVTIKKLVHHSNCNAPILII